MMFLFHNLRKLRELGLYYDLLNPKSYCKSYYFLSVSPQMVTHLFLWALYLLIEVTNITLMLIIIIII